MATKGNYLVNGNIVKVFSEGDVDIISKLPLGTYMVKRNPTTGEMYLKRTYDLSVEKKIYGNMPSRVDRILHTFDSRNTNTGILLSGVKGSGKTFLAKELSAKLREKGISTILVNDVFNSTQLSQFLQNIAEPAMVFFDEFEKVYRKGSEYGDDDESCGNSENGNGDQNGLLSLLDGIFTTKKLFVFTCNSTWNISNLFFNRPGRIFYHIEFKGLPVESIKEYCEEKLNNKEWIENVISISKILKDFTFDQLQAIVEESNRYNEKPTECLEMLNINPETDRGRYQVEIRSLGKTKYTLEDARSLIWANPLEDDGFGVRVIVGNSKEDTYFQLRPDNLVSYRDDKAVFVKDDLEVTLTKVSYDDNLWRFAV